MRITKPTNSGRASADRFGLFALIETKRVILPLKGVECDFLVISGLAEFTMKQIFRQENDRPVDCEYLFPLPADASVYHCEADINGRKIRAQVRERQEARRIAAEKKAGGFRTALVESERENLFTLSLGNVQPGDLVIIELKYFQPLRFLAGKPSLEIPFCPGVRYIPGNPLLRANRGKGVVDDTDQVPDASRITPPRIDSEHPDAAYVEVRGTVDGRFIDEARVESPSHEIDVRKSGGQLSVTLSDKGEVPDRDFVLRWTETECESLASRAWTREKDGQTYALLEVRAPKAAPARRGPVDFYFLVDRSGSMCGQKWTKAIEALHSAVKMLDAADRVMITFFSSQFQDFSESPQCVGELLEDRVFHNLGQLSAGGGTELLPALRHTLEVAARESANRHRNLILITDFQVGNDAAILKAMAGTENFPVHCFGIDVAVNDALLRALCRQQGGTYHSMNPNDDIQAAVTTLASTLAQPVLLDPRLPQGWETAEASIPNLYAGQVHYLSARCPNGGPLELSARAADASPVRIPFERQCAAVDAPYLHWCKSRIQRLMAEGNRDAIALSIESNLICPLTAFVAWDESEKVAIANHELVQPSHNIFNTTGLIRYAVCPPADRAPEADRQILRQYYAFAANALSEPTMPLSTAEANELQARTDLSWARRRSGIPVSQALFLTIWKWAESATGDERIRRVEAVRKLLHELRPHLDKLNSANQDEQDQAKIQLQCQLESFLKQHVITKDAK